MPYCVGDHDIPGIDGDKVPATWLVPQSRNAGLTITYTYACDGHQENWWDGADWNGRALEYRLDNGNLDILPLVWLERLFMDENCAECGRDENGHEAVPFIGNWFARCS